MKREFTLPEMSEDEGQAAIVGWLVAVGDEVSADEPVVEVETDKATAELEIGFAGTLVEIVVPEGTEGVTAGTVLARFETPDSAPADPPAQPPPAETETESEAVEPGPADEADRGASRPPADGEPVRDVPQEQLAATPLARRKAALAGVDLETLQGTGAHGKIVVSDVTPASAGDASPAPAEQARPRAARPVPASRGDAPFELEPLSATRRTIARRMLEAKQTAPHFYLRIRCEVDALLALRKRLNDARKDLHLSVNDFAVRALALALREVPDAHVAYSDEGLRRFSRADIAVAVASPRGLLAPIVRGADGKGLEALSAEIRDLAERAKAGQLAGEELSGGTFTVSNLGMFGIETVYPILNPPQAGILGVGAAEAMPVVREGAEGAEGLEIARVMVCTLSADHRAVDGAAGAELLASLKRYLEHPLDMVL